jgi:hypothetical protein
MLKTHHAHDTTTRVGGEYTETMKLNDHFRLGMLNLLREKNIQFGADSNEEQDIEDNLLNSAELELEDIRNI